MWKMAASIIANIIENFSSYYRCSHMINSTKKTERELILRNEKATDITAITEVTIAAFKNHPISNSYECKS